MYQPDYSEFDGFNSRDLWQKDKDHLIHPQSVWPSFKEKGCSVFVKGEGAYLFDADGNRYLDSNGGLWSVNIGYGNAELAEAIAEQARLLPQVNHFGAGGGTGGKTGRYDAGRAEPRVLHQRRHRRQRQRHPDDPPLLHPAGQTGKETHHRQDRQLPRHFLHDGLGQRQGQYPAQPLPLRGRHHPPDLLAQQLPAACGGLAGGIP